MTKTGRFINCGMYSFTEPQRAAWQQLFDRFFESSGIEPGRVAVRFEHDPELLRDPALWFGHTCGYPLMTAQRDFLAPFCVPLFDVPGISGTQYCSQIIVGAGSSIDSVEAARGRISAMNNPDSNSGMNVLRHAVARVAGGDSRFFARVLTTGGHQASLEAVARGKADIAAIDCVSFQLIADALPELVERVAVIGQTVQTCGLPLVLPRADFSDGEADRLCDNLSRALSRCEPDVSRVLHLEGFARVSLEDYAGILAVEQNARDLGYPELA